MENPAEIARDLAATVRARALVHGPKQVRSRPPPEPIEAPVAAVDGWESLRTEALGCEACGLSRTRTTVVFGEGALDAELVFVGEAPGADEDRQGRPFVGRAGQLLTQMIQGMGFAREDVYIANVLKCRPPKNRDPAADEVEKCHPFLMRQLDLIQPKIVCALGRHALHTLTGYKGAISKVRGRPMAFRGLQVLPTFHPAYLLRNPAAKREAWEDLKTILRMLGRPIPEPRSERKKRPE